MGIGSRIRVAVEAMDLTLREAAERCSIPYSSLQNWVGGHRAPRIESIVTIGSQLGISVDWLLTGEGSMFRYGGATGVAEPAQAQAGDPREQALLTLFRELGEEDQREIQHAAEEKKRLKRLEQRIAELEAVVADAKRMA